MTAERDAAGAILTVDLDAVIANWRRLQGLLGRIPCAAVVKADAYGLGLARVAPALARAGCRTFFVALPDEGVALRRLLPAAEIAVLAGAFEGAEPILGEHDLIPVLNEPRQIATWGDAARRHGRKLPAILHLDTGMNRLGLTMADIRRLAESPAALEAIDLRYVMSHLACADEPDHPMNRAQLVEFARRRALLPAAPASLANSAGIHLGPEYHFDLGRPGAALYGLAPLIGRPNPMTQTVSLRARILQVRRVDSPGTVGYGATHRVTPGNRIATVAVGYADGFLRALSNRGMVHIGDIPVSVVGRVSMDLITVDVSKVPESAAHPGAFVDLIGPRQTADDLGERAGTNGYEILTALGARYRRDYTGGEG